MSEKNKTIRNSPVTFETAVGYALHREMRRLILTFSTGALVLSAGLGILDNTDSILELGPGMVVTIGGAVLFFGGLVGAAFKLVTDANRLANSQ